jgi:RNA polymerase sigma factor (sigma-70 family)
MKCEKSGRCIRKSLSWREPELAADWIGWLLGVQSRQLESEILAGARPIVPVLTDAELVANIQNGQSASEATLYEKYSAKIYYLALRESKSAHDAEDVRAETFLRVLLAIRGGQVRSPAALPGFIVGVTRNVLRELYARRSQAGTVADPGAVEPAAPSYEKLFLEQEAQQAVQRAIERLKPRERAVLRMHYYEELPTEEIAQRAAIAPERVRLVKSRALKHFREIYSRLKRTSRKDW